MHHDYLVLTVDIIDSRYHIQTAERRQELLSTLERFYHEHSDLFLSRLCLSRGDEIQAVLASAKEAVPLLRRLRAVLNPVNIRASFGIGTLTSDFIAEDPWAMDGPAFHRARQGLSELKVSKKQRTAWVSGNIDVDQRIGLILMLVDTIQERWTKGQWQAVNVYEKAGTFEEAAKIMGVRYQNVEKRCRAAHWSVIHEAEKRLGDWIEQVIQQV